MPLDDDLAQRTSDFRGLAFIDLTEDVIVQFDCEANLNRDCLSPSNGTTRAIEEWTQRGTHWRLRDTER